MSGFFQSASLIALVWLSCSVAHAQAIPLEQTSNEPPTLSFPDPRIAEVYLGNWRRTLLPCKSRPTPTQPAGPHVEPNRPWKVNVDGHYPGWYPGVDEKHLAAAYLACGSDLPLVLRGWELTSEKYQMPDGGIQPSTMKDNPQGVWPETNSDQSVVFYPLRLTATIDYLLLGDLIFRYSQDRNWLKSQLPRMRRAAEFIAGWVDPDGLLHSDSYDLDQVFREIDGVAQASAILALRRLADLESVVSSPENEEAARNLARRLSVGTRLFWIESERYYAEHLVYRTVASDSDKSVTVSASSELDTHHAARRTIDAVTGIGIDAFGAAKGAAGRSEWAACEETGGAWIRIEFPQPTQIGGAILVNRTDPSVQAGERFSNGSLEFSDGGPPVAVEFNRLSISRASVRFPERTVRWIRFRGDKMQGTGGTNAGLAELRVLSSEQPHRRITHGMTDTNFAMLGFDVADEQIAAHVWTAFRHRESRFHEWNGIRAPTWISDQAESYTPLELNRRAPRKDCVAMGRTWRYEALMRRRMKDGDGLYQTIRDAIALYDRPSGGGAGFFAERYGLGKFQPGDESQANVPKYAEYPAVFASVVVQECLLGLTVDVRGAISIAPCVPTDWYAKGFGATGCGVVHGHEIGFTYSAGKVEGTLAGPSGTRTVFVAVPPALLTQSLRVIVNGEARSTKLEGESCRLEVPLDGKQASTFAISAASGTGE